MPNFTNYGLLFFLAFFISGVKSQAQFSETIQSGRPGQSIVANTVGKGVLQFQQGFIYDHNTTKVPLTPGSSRRADYILKSYITENVLRYGVLEKFEINAAINYTWIDQDIEPPLQILDFEGGYISALDIGGRLNITQQRNFLPTMALQARLGMGQSYHESDFTVSDVEITAALAWQLGANHGLTVNFIPIFNIDGFDNRYNYTLAYSWSFAQDWSLFIENYGGYTAADQVDGFFSTYFDGGFAWIMNNNVQFDILGGYGKNEIYFDDVESFFVSAGISWRIQTIN